MLRKFLLLLILAVCVLLTTEADARTSLNKRAELATSEPKRPPKPVYYPKAVVATISGQGGLHGTVKFTLRNTKDGGATNNHKDAKDTQTEVFVEVNLYQVPKGLLPYHIHEKAITNGDCNSAGGHFNPTKCDSKNDKNCRETGDLSKKHQPLNGDKGGEIHLSYADPSLKLSPSQRGILGRSIVIHTADLKRIACANIPLGTPLEAPRKEAARKRDLVNLLF